MTLDASLAELKSAAAGVEDDMFKMQLRLTLDVLAGAVASAMQSLSPATVNDVDFALNDVAGTVNELNAADADAMTPALEKMRAEVDALKQATALPANAVAGIQRFQAKLKARRTAIERRTYRAEGAPDEPLPFPPEELASEAKRMSAYLATLGFATPSLDEFIADPSSLVFASIGGIIDELDVIIGA